MKRITKEAWDRVHEKACDFANAVIADDDVLSEVYRSQILEIMDDLQNEFGLHPEILDTRADFLDDPVERRKLYNKALNLARDRQDPEEIETILKSLRHLDEDIEMSKKF